MGVMQLARVFDDLPEDLATVTVNLIDALREYVRSGEAYYRDALDEESFDLATYQRAMRDLEVHRRLLRELECDGVNPTLEGLIRCK